MANFDDWLAAVVPVLFVVFWVISQVMGLKKAQTQRHAQELPNEDPQEDVADELAKEIERFLGKDRLDQKEPAEQQQTARHRGEPVVAPNVVRTPAAPPPTRRQKSSRRKKRTKTPSVSRKQEGTQHSGSDLSASFKQQSASDANEETIIQLPTDSEDFATMMENPSTLRQAFILSQIFSRPEDRW